MSSNKESLAAVASAPKLTTATVSSASSLQMEMASLTQANATLKAKNKQATLVANTIITKAEELQIPEKLTLSFILRNWRKIGEFIEQVIHMLKALRNNQ